MPEGDGELMALSSQKRTAGEALAAAKRKEDMNTSNMTKALVKVRHGANVLKLQSGVRSLFARKDVWTQVVGGGRPINEGDMASKLGSCGATSISFHATRARVCCTLQNRPPQLLEHRALL